MGTAHIKEGGALTRGGAPRTEGGAATGSGAERRKPAHNKDKGIVEQGPPLEHVTDAGGCEGTGTLI